MEPKKRESVINKRIISKYIRFGKNIIKAKIIFIFLPMYEIKFPYFSTNVIIFTKMKIKSRRNARSDVYVYFKYLYNVNQMECSF